MNLRAANMIRKVFKVSVVLFLMWAIISEMSLTKFPDLDTFQSRDDIAIRGIPAKKNSVGQTFVAKKPYLSSIIFVLDSYRKDNEAVMDSYMFLHLYDRYDNEIASARYRIPDNAENFEIEFSFTPQPDSLNKNYYALIETNVPENQLSISSSFHNAYENGDAYVNGNALPYDLAFRTYYKPPMLFWVTETLNESWNRFAHLFTITFVFLSIGLSVCSLLGYLSKDLVENVIYSIVIGLVIPPILFLAMGLLRIEINKHNIFSVLMALIVLTSIKFLKTFRSVKFHFSGLVGQEIVILTLMFLVAAFTRVSQINQLFVPNWVGGLVHQEFIARILERQAISFETIYPKGFHANVVFDFLLFGGSPIESTLLIGQWLSLVSGLAFYLLARKLLPLPYSLFAVALYWFWSPFPAFLINWGRYPYLQSLVILPALVHICNNKIMSRFSKNALLSMLIIGIGATYYGGLLIFIAFMIASITIKGSEKERLEDLSQIKNIGLTLLPFAVILIIRLLRAFELNIYGQDANAGLYEDSIQALEISLVHGGWLIWGLGIPGIALAVAFKAKRFFFIMKWLLALFIFNLLQVAFNITVSSLANTIIFLTIPLTLLAGLAFRFLWVITMQHAKLLFYILTLLMAVGGAYNISGIIQPSYVLFSSSDKSAMEWINHNTSSSSLFLINSFYWGDDLSPSDAGGWLTIMTSRQSVLYNPDSFERSLENDDIDYIYIGRGYGAISAEFLLNDRQFAVVYDKGDVMIFKRLP